MSYKILLLFALLVNSIGPAFPQQKEHSDLGVTLGSLTEIKDKRRAFLLVRKSYVVDARDVAKTVLADAYRSASISHPSHRSAYNAIAKKLNKYIHEYQSMGAAPRVADADFIIAFNVLEVRRLIGGVYPYGEMFVVTNTPAEPRLLWKTKGNLVTPGDAISDFIKARKVSRGEN